MESHGFAKRMLPCHHLCHHPCHVPRARIYDSSKVYVYSTSPNEHVRVEARTSVRDMDVTDMDVTTCRSARQTWT